MKNFLSIFVLSGLFFCSLLNSFAQEKIISEQELNNLKANAYKKLEGKTYRVTMISKIYRNDSDSSPYYISKDVSEYISPDRSRGVNETTNEKGTTRTETISINQKRYIRKNNEDWEEYKPSKSVRSTVQGDRVDMSNKTTIEAKYKGQTKINNQSADLYEIQTTSEFMSANGRTNNVYISIERFWFNKDGLILKREFEAKPESGQNISQTTWEYDYNPKIKIEAPIIKNKMKQHPN